MKTTENERATYTAEEAAKVLGISRATVYRMLNDGQLKGVKLRGRTMISRAVVEVLLAP